MTSRDVPFHGQKWNLDAWHTLGFPTRDAATYWQNASCGPLCIKMAVEGMTGKETQPISQIIRHGMRLNAYTHKDGWSHRGLVLLANLLGVPAVAMEPLSVADIKHFLDQGSLCIVSVRWAFEPSRSLVDRILFWRAPRGGHLALVVGYDATGFYVHHTSVQEGYNWENQLIPFAQFKKSFTGRGVVLGA